MLAMVEIPPRGGRKPSSMGVPVPPRERFGSKPDSETPSLPPEDRETILAWLRMVHESQIALKDQVERRDADVERRLNLLEQGVLRIQTLDAKFDALNERLWQNAQRDNVTRDELRALELRVVQRASTVAKQASQEWNETEGTEANAEAARKATRPVSWTAIAIAVISLIGTIVTAIAQIASK